MDVTFIYSIYYCVTSSQSNAGRPLPSGKSREHGLIVGLIYVSRRGAAASHRSQEDRIQNEARGRRAARAQLGARVIMRGSSRARSREWERRGVQRADCGARAGGGRRSLKSSGIRTNERRERPDEPRRPAILDLVRGLWGAYVLLQTYFIFIPGRHRMVPDSGAPIIGVPFVHVPHARRDAPRRPGGGAAAGSLTRPRYHKCRYTRDLAYRTRLLGVDTAPSARRPISKAATKGARDPTATQKHLGTLDPVPRLK